MTAPSAVNQERRQFTVEELGVCLIYGGADEVIVLDRRRQVARNDRSSIKGSTTLLLDHYLEVMVGKAGAPPGATAYFDELALCSAAYGVDKGREIGP